MPCPSCHQDLNHAILRLEGLPVLCNALWPDGEQARSCPRGEMDLVLCEYCGLLFNRAFEPSLMAYAADYETSLHFSPTFQEYADDLARSLVQEHDLVGRSAIEIGCGRGEFLVLLAQAGMGHCLGFDRSFSADLVTLPEGVEIRSHYYSDARPGPTADLVCSRHVLEHIPEPGRLLEELASALEPSALLYLEVPNALYTLQDLGIWDLIYEHCNYFTPPSLRWTLEAQGFGGVDVRSAYGGQFLSSWSRKGHDRRSPTRIDEGPSLLRLAQGLARSRTEKIESFEEDLRQALDAGQRTAIWGAGSKGVTFLNSLPSGMEIATAIDKNPRKQGKHLPGTGQKILSPEEAAEAPLDLVFVMNPIYAREIEEQLRELGSRAELVLV